MKKLTLLFAMASLLSSSSYAICPFYDTFNVATKWGNGEIKVLNVTPKEGDARVAANQFYNPSYLGSYLYWTTFTIAGGACENNNFTGYSRTVEATVGYDTDNYCIVTITDGTNKYVSLNDNDVRCTGRIAFDRLDDRAATDFFSVGDINHQYYLYFKPL